MSERLAQCPYVADRAGFEPTTLRLTAISTIPMNQHAPQFISEVYIFGFYMDTNVIGLGPNAFPNLKCGPELFLKKSGL